MVRVDAEDGRVLWQADEPERRHVLDAAVACRHHGRAQDVLTRGTGTAVRASGFKAPAAGKTGTTSDGADTWFVGYTPEIVAAVWMGFDRVAPDHGQATGGRLAAPVWARLMTRASTRAASRPRGGPCPRASCRGLVDPQTGLLLASGARRGRGSPTRRLFVQGAVPVTVCPSQGPIMTAEMLPLPALPDYEEGMETGVPLGRSAEAQHSRWRGGSPRRQDDDDRAHAFVHALVADAGAEREARPKSRRQAGARGVTRSRAQPTPSPGLPL